MPIYPAHWEADVVLRDGRTAHLRPVTPQDAEGVVRFYAGVSDESKYYRFFAPYPRLSARDIDRLTNVDYDTDVVLVATVAGEIIGLVEYFRSSADKAEVAFLVQDAHQGRGLASILLEHLAEVARERGIHRFTADVLAGNRHMLAVFRAAGYSVKSSTEDGVVSLSFDVGPTEASRAVTQEREHRAEARSVARLLTPRWIGVAGASRTGRGVGAAVLRHLVEAEFTGRLYAVHPKASEVCGVTAYRRFAKIPDGIDLAVLAVPAPLVAPLIADAAAAGARGVVVVSEGFAETGTAEGRAMQRELVRLTRSFGMRLLGPTALGLINTDPAVRLNASLSPRLPPHGSTAFFAQSGALGITLLENVGRRGIGLSSFVSAGNRADISGNDMLQYWQDDPGTTSVMLYLESIGNPRKFSRLARRVGRVKPLVAVRSTSATQGVPLGHSVRHTELPPAAIEAMYEQAGVIGVDNIHEMFDVAQLLDRQPVPAGSGVAIVGNSDPLSLLAAAACSRYGLSVVRERVNLGSAATADELAAALATAAADPAVHSIVVTVARRTEGSIAQHIAAVEAAAARGAQTVVATYAGRHRSGRVDRVDGLDPDRVPAYPTPEDAVHALAAVTAYGEWRRRPDIGEPALDGIRTEEAVSLVEGALAGRPEGVELDRASLGTLLSLYGIQLGSAAGTPDPTPNQPAAAPEGQWVTITSCEDTLFGPVVSFGLSGVIREVLGDVAYRIPPFTELDARELVVSVRAAPLLLGHDDLPGLDLESLIDLVIRVGRLAYDVPDLAALNISAFVRPSGVTVADASCRLEESPVRIDRPARSLPDADAEELVVATAAGGAAGSSTDAAAVRAGARGAVPG